MSEDKPPDIPGIADNLYSEDKMNQYIENDHVEEILKRDRDKKKEQRRLKRCKELGIDPNLYDDYKYFRQKTIPTQEQLDERYRKKLRQNAEYYKRRKKKKLLESLSKTAEQRDEKDNLKVEDQKSTTYKEAGNMKDKYSKPHTFISSISKLSASSNVDLKKKKSLTSYCYNISTSELGETAQVLLSLKKNQQETFTSERK